MGLQQKILLPGHETIGLLPGPDARLQTKESRVPLHTQDGVQDDLNSVLAAFPAVLLDSESSPSFRGFYNASSSAFHALNPGLQGSTPKTE